MTPEQVAAQALACDRSLLRSERIKSGLTNESWRVFSAGHDVVVRISRADERALQIDRASETRILGIVAQAGIGAPVIMCEPNLRLLVTCTLPGRNWLPEEAHAAPNIARLAALLHRLHCLPIPADVHVINFKAVLQGYWAELDTHSRASDQDLAQRAHALQIAESSSLSVQRALCHTDIHHLNLIDDGQRLWLVDWEYAGIGDIYFDLASVCCFHHYDETTRRELLQRYFGGVSIAAVKRLEQMCWLFDYIKELWFAVRGCSEIVDDAGA